MKPAIVFDLDGTLVNSAPDIHAAANRMLADVGEEPLSLETVTSFIGNGIPNLVRLVLESRGIPGAREEEMRALMLKHYTAHPADLTLPYPGVLPLLEALKAAGYPLGVCTNKFRAPAVQILEALDLMKFFGVVIGGDSLPVKKPDPAPLFAAYEALNTASGIYVGDSEVDAETAQAARVPFALYSGGYRKTPVSELPATVVFDHFDDLEGLLGLLT